jgi:hypothetical protein
MKCLYFLAPTLADTHEISDDLHAVGVQDFFLHVISRDEAGLKKQHVHSSNYLETLDLARSGIIGGLVGLVAGVVGVALLRHFDPIGIEIPNLVSYAIVGVATLFGTWEGGLVGIATENRKLAKFHDDIQAGKFLVLIYALKDQEDSVKNMMRTRHPEAKLVAVDRHFVNPFSSPRKDAADEDAGNPAAGKV